MYVFPLNKDISPLPLSPTPHHQPSHTWFHRASVCRARIDGLAVYAIRRGRTDYKAEMWRELHDQMARLTEDCSAIG